ncbi:MAG: metallophosphoesterase [Planctomycetia bacterium]|nr:metallophosphoesterase [Planctomycetia bacterium]
MLLSRRNFMQLSAGFCLASTLPATFPAMVLGDETGTEKSSEQKLKLKSLRVSVGAEKPFRAVHISDTHLCYADERDNERKRNLATSRRRYFGDSERYFRLALQHAQKNDALFLHTGDLIDFVSASNLDAVKNLFCDTNSYVSSGNHEFSQYVGESKEDAAYKAQSYARVQDAFPNDLTFCSRIVNGVNLVAIDDVYYNFTHVQLERFQAEVEKGLPIVMMCHCPLYTPELFDEMMTARKSQCAYLVGVPKERLGNYSAHRYEQQCPDIPTLEFIAWLRKQPLLKAIFCGHLHFHWSGKFSETATQYVVSANYQGDAYDITFC